MIKKTFLDIKFLILIAGVCMLFLPELSNAQIVTNPLAMVDAVQGRSEIFPSEIPESPTVTIGRILNPGSSIKTNEQSKVILHLENGIVTSVGGLSYVSFDQEQPENGLMDIIDLNEGVLRMTKRSGGGNLTPYKVVTPVASIEPANYNEAVDFIVEAYTPTSAVISVLSGQVIVRNLTLGAPAETIVSSCQMAYIDRGANADVLAANYDQIIPLLDETRISKPAQMSFICPVPEWLTYRF